MNPLRRIDLRQRDLDTLRSVFRKFPSVNSVTVFGSRATGHACRTSDIDLAIDAPAMPPREWADLTEALENAPIIHCIDTVRLDTLPPGPLLDSIRRDGISLTAA